PISKAKIEELKTIIQEIIAKKADRAESLGVFGGDIQFKIIKALKEHDPVFIQTFFESKIRHMDLGGSDKKVIYIALINTLYSFFASEGLAKYIQTPQETAQHQLVMMQSTSQMEHYVEGLYLDAIQFVEERLNNKEEAVIGRIKEYVEQNYGNENLSVAFLSEKLFVSVSYLGSIFKAVEQRNLSTYITAVRMEKACELLQKPYIKVAEVAALVGYHDPLYFAKVFKKVKGSTPSDYQRLHF
ncbi:MAG: AraC family transcriptional regulator, partial [Angelakisella sp.]